jgi:hypothetical protein
VLGVHAHDTQALHSSAAHRKQVGDSLFALFDGGYTPSGELMMALQGRITLRIEIRGGCTVFLPVETPDERSYAPGNPEFCVSGDEWHWP